MSMSGLPCASNTLLSGSEQMHPRNTEHIQYPSFHASMNVDGDAVFPVADALALDPNTFVWMHNPDMSGELVGSLLAGVAGVAEAPFKDANVGTYPPGSQTSGKLAAYDMSSSLVGAPCCCYCVVHRLTSFGVACHKPTALQCKP